MYKKTFLYVDIPPLPKGSNKKDYISIGSYIPVTEMAENSNMEVDVASIDEQYFAAKSVVDIEEHYSSIDIRDIAMNEDNVTIDEDDVIMDKNDENDPDYISEQSYSSQSQQFESIENVSELFPSLELQIILSKEWKFSCKDHLNSEQCPILQSLGFSYFSLYQILTCGRCQTFVPFSNAKSHLKFHFKKRLSDVKLETILTHIQSQYKIPHNQSREAFRTNMNKEIDDLHPHGVQTAFLSVYCPHCDKWLRADNNYSNRNFKTSNTTNPVLNNFIKHLSKFHSVTNSELDPVTRYCQPIFDLSTSSAPCCIPLKLGWKKANTDVSDQSDALMPSYPKSLEKQLLPDYINDLGWDIWLSNRGFKLQELLVLIQPSECLKSTLEEEQRLIENGLTLIQQFIQNLLLHAHSAIWLKGIEISEVLGQGKRYVSKIYYIDLYLFIFL